MAFKKKVLIKKDNKLIIFIASVLSASILLFIFSFVFGSGMKNEMMNEDKKITIFSSSEVTNKTYVGTGSVVDVRGTINGDAFLAGANINFSGVVNGNLLVFGDQINISGIVNGNIITAGNSINITSANTKMLLVAGNVINIGSKISENAYIAGNIVSTLSNSSFGRDLFVAANSVAISSIVNRDLNVASNGLYINGIINGNASIDANFINANSSSIINKDLIISPSSDLRSLREITNGNIIFNEDNNNSGKLRNADFIFSLLSKLSIGLFTVLIIGILLIKFFEKSVNSIINNNYKNFTKNLGVGFAILFGAPLLMITLAITVIGIKLAFIILAVYSVWLILSSVLSAILIGEFIIKSINHKKEASLHGSLVIGYLMIIILSIIPVAGWITLLVITAASFGAMNTYRKEIYVAITKHVK